MTTAELSERMVYPMADTLTFPVTLPREFVTWLGAPAQAAETAREYVLLGLYLEGRISGGKAAEQLGLTRRGFVSLLARKGIDYFRLTSDEWAEEVSLVNDWSTPRG
jgi:predicted HTH domain antitoxin